MNTKALSVSDLSPHIFWDVAIENLDLERNKKLIIFRILDYGLYSDWKLALGHYGIEEIARIAKDIKELDKKSACFVALLSDTPQEQFSCFISKLSMPEQSIF